MRDDLAIERWERNEPMRQPISREDAADELREQAASCRRLSRRARTAGGYSALTAVAVQFDDDARRIDPSSEKHWAPGDDE
jgi:hypothetical protein